ncbi:MAG: VCBS repeat-containing protein [Myxococcales bacterium]|nr:VCBS repeat-containing protein [Myxococcales bacterium]
MPSPSRIAALSVLAALATSCAEFVVPVRGVCGNRIVESGEDCDDPDDPQCGAANVEAACRLLCTPASGEEDEEDEEGEEGEELAVWRCEDGQRCGRDGVCRTPAGTFSDAPLRIDEAGARSIQRGDLDGDGRDELVFAFSEPDGMDVKVVYGDALDESTIVTLVDPIIAVLAVGDLTGDGLDDVFVAPESTPQVTEGSRVSLWRGSADRVPGVSVFPTLRTAGDDARLLVPTPERDRVLELAPAATRRWASGEAEAEELAPAAVDVARLGRRVAAADLDPNNGTCAGGPTLEGFARAELALALAGDGAVRLASSCGVDGLTELGSVALGGGTLGEAGALLVDGDGDGALDLLTQDGAGRVLIAYGVGDGGFHSSPAPQGAGDGAFASAPLLPVVTPGAGTLLAAADFDGDDALELVTERAFYPDPASCDASACERFAWPRPLEEAAAIDFNGDGALDVVGLHDDVLMVHLGGALGPLLFAAHEVGLNGAARELAVGDFNHDTVADVAFAELFEDELPSRADEVVRVVYGGSPSAWALESFGPFIEIERVVVEQTSRIVARTHDEQLRPAGAFIEPGAVEHDFGVALRRPTLVRAGEPAVAAVLVRPGDDAPRLGLLGFQGGTLSPYDVTTGDALDGSDAAGFHTLTAAIDLDGDDQDELLVLGPREGAGGVWVARLDPASRTWVVTSAFSVGPGFAARPIDAVSLAADHPPPGGGPGTTIAIGDLDGDGDPDVLATTDEPSPRVVALRNDDGALTAAGARVLTSPAAPALQLAHVAPWHADALGRARWVFAGVDGVALGRVNLAASTLELTPLLDAEVLAMTTADVNGDGLLDLALADAEEVSLHLAEESVGAPAPG